MVEFIDKDIESPEFQHPNVVLVKILSFVAVRPHGLPQELGSKYPHFISAGQPLMGKMNPVVVKDRPMPGILYMRCVKACPR